MVERRSERTAQRRRSVTRRVPTRRGDRLTNRTQQKALTFTQKRKRQKAEREFLNKVEKASENFLQRAKNINELTSLQNEFVRRNIGKVPERLQKDFRNISKKEAQKVIERQKNLVSELKKDIKGWKKREDKYDDRGDEEEDERRKIRYKGKEEYYDELQKEAKKILSNRLNKGDILDKKKLYSFLKQKADIEKEKREAKEKRRLAEEKAEQKAEQKELEIKEYFKKPQVLAAPPSVSTIKKDLDVDTRTAKIIQDAAQESAKSKVDFVRKIERTIDKGARYSDKQLRNAGLSGSEIREVKQKQTKENKQLENKLDSFSNRLQDKLKDVKVESKVNKFLQFVGKDQKEKPQSFLPSDVREVTSFKNLNPFEKNAALTYVALNNIRDKSKNVSKDIENIKERAAFNLLPKSAIAELSGVDLKKAVDLKKFDPKKITNLSKLSKEDLKKISIEQNTDKINEIINNYNNFANNVESINKFEKKLNTNRLKELIKSYEGKLAQNLRKKGIDVTEKDLKKPTYKNLVGSQIVYTAALAELNKALKSNKQITDKQYQNYKKALNDVLGLKELAKKSGQAIAKNKKEYGNLLGAFKSLVAILKFTGKSAQETWKELNRDAFFLGQITRQVFLKAKKVDKNLSKDFADLLKYTSQTIKGIPKSKREKLFKRTKSSFEKAFKTTKQISTFVKENPELVVLGLSLGVASGLKISRKTIVNEPEKAVGFVASFFVDGLIISKGAKGLKASVKTGKLLKNKALNTINDIIRKTKKLPSIKIIKNKIFKKGKELPVKINFKTVPDDKFRFPVKDSEGTVRFLDKAGSKKFRKSVTSAYSPKQIEPDLIKQTSRIKRKQLKELKKSTRAQREAIEKQRRALRKAQKEKSKVTPKSKRPEKFDFYDIQTGNTRTFTNRKKWLNAVKRQEKLLKEGKIKLPKRLESGKFLKDSVERTNVKLKNFLRSSDMNKNPTPKKRFVIKDSTGKKRYIDGKTLKKFKEAVKKQTKGTVKTKKLNVGLIEQWRNYIKNKQEYLRNRQKFLKISDKKNRKLRKTALRRVKGKQRRKVLKRKKNEKIKKQKDNIVEIIIGNKKLKIDPKKRKVQEFVEVDKPIKSDGGRVLLQKQEYKVREKTVPKQQQKAVVKTAEQKLEQAFPTAKQKYGFAKKKKITKKTQSQDLKLLKNPKVSGTRKVKTALKYLSIQDIYNIFAKPIQLFRRLNITRKDLKKLQDKQLMKISKIGRITQPILKKIPDTLIDLDRKKIKTPEPIKKPELKKVQKLVDLKPPKKEEIKKIKRLKLKLQWDSKPPKGFNRLVNPVVRVGGRAKELNIRTTPNRALNYITKLIDNTTSRSFSLKSVGLTRAKDVKAKTITKKFRPRKKRNSKILDYVEKSKFAIDTKGEKAGLKLSRVIKSGKRTKKNKSPSVRKRGSKKGTTKKKSSAKKSKVRSKSSRSKKRRR